MLGLLAGACSQSPWQAMQEGFQTPPDSVRVAVYWYWLDNNISKEGVIKDLEAMKQVGITRAFIGNQSTDDPSENRVPLFSEEWWDITHTAMKTAGDLDIELGMFNCPGWSQSGGPWVTPKQSMKYLEGHFLQVSGNGAEQEWDLPVPMDRIVAIQAYQTVKGESQTWAFQLKEGRPLSVRLKPAKNFPVHSLILESDGVQRTPVVFSADGKPLASFEFDRHNTGLNVGFRPLAPWVEGVPENEAREFLLVFAHPEEDSQVRVTLSEVPQVPRYAEKTLSKMFQDPLPLWDAYMWDYPEYVKTRYCIDPLVMFDLREFVGGGKLRWKVPDGNWTILTSYMESTGVTNSPAVPEGTGLEVDKMSKQYLAQHYDAFVGELLRRIPAGDRKSWKVVVEDSYETGGQNWTDDMVDVFRKTYGYDPVPYLPVLQGQVVGAMEESERFLWDMRRLVADRVAYDYVGGLRELSNRDGLETWLECYGHWGFPSEFLLYGSQSNQIAGEYWSEGSLGDIENRAASSCGHIYGKNRIWAESCTAAGNPWSRYPRMMKQRVDRFFCEGINATLLHLFIQQADDRQPGKAAWFGNEFNRNSSWFEGMGSFVEYLRRCNYMLQQGRYVADVVYFIGEDAPKMTGVCDPALPEGYSFDYINADVLRNHARVRNGKLVLDSGMEYRVLVLPRQESMRPEMAECLQRFVEEGLTLVGPAPTRSPSMQHGIWEADERVKKAAEQIWNGSGKGLVYPDGTSLETVLEDMGMEPDFSYTGEGHMAFIHRTLGADGDLYFVANQEEAAVDVLPAFRVRPGLKAQLWDPLTGAICDWDGGEVHLEPLQSLFVVFGKEADLPSADDLACGEESPLQGPWTVEFAASAGKPSFTRTFPQLDDWSCSEDPEVKYYSGHATYKTQFTLPEASAVKLDLGEVMVVADVKVNGEKAGGVWTFPYSLDISHWVKKGENSLEITVYNNWRNRLIADETLPEDQRGTWTNIQPWTASDPLQPSGLLGPVTIMIQ